MMKILGIESSCDETAAAVVLDGKKILSSAVASSANLHKKTGGIIPEQAARQQILSIIPVVTEALAEAGLKPNGIDTLAVTSGPGLIGSLLVGVEAAKTLSLVWDRPIIPVNHLVAHLYANWLEKDEPPKFPALGLVVSGGHTDLVLMEGHNKLSWISGTRDDAAGEAFDKCARLLGLSYPGGPSISAAAEKYLDKNPRDKLNLFPRPLIDDKSLDWSFSGLKTSVANFVKDNKKLSTKRMCAEIQEAIVDSLLTKVARALIQFKPKSFLLAGGVAANKRLREKLKKRIVEENINTKIFVPEIQYCTDNATYIASFAYYNPNKMPLEKIDADPQLSISDIA